MYLVFNVGSSSKKVKVFSKEKSVIKEFFFKQTETGYIVSQDFADYTSISIDVYMNPTEYIIQNSNIKISDIGVIIHRVVHGGEEFTEPVEIDDLIISKLERYNDLAPLHNPQAIDLIKSIQTKYKDVKQIACFDTSFHLTNKQEEFLYGLPYGYYENLRIRKFGFHGISYSFINREISDLNYKKVIACHLGSGSSVCAIQNGKSIRHSFGFTPNENLIMATRSGEVDYDAIIYLKNKLSLSDKEIEILLNKESGLLGISGYSKDMKQLVSDYSSNERAKLAVDMYCDKVVDYIAMFFNSLHGCDALIFTGGIGEASWVIREMIINKLNILGFEIDENLNDNFEISNSISIKKVSKDSSRSDILVIKTDEELEMLQTFV